MAYPAGERQPRIAIAGLATSHPFSDAATIGRLRPGAAFDVWDSDADRVAEFERRNPGHHVHDQLADLVDRKPDGIILTVRPDQVAAALDVLLPLGVPVFVNKPAAATRSQLRDLTARCEPVAHRVLTSSVLRFAAPVARLARRLDRDRVLSARAVVRHDVGRWATGSTPWQDDPSVGGGAIVTMGLHGVELLVALLGREARAVAATSARRIYPTLRSADSATLLLCWADGVQGTVDVVGAAQSESYGVSVETADGPIGFDLPDGSADPLGYTRTVEEFLAMVEVGAPSPVAWSETVAILDLLISAVELESRSTR
ncbi:Gfo/Idh/MocA family protein [Polymorphospora rubra]|uniref:GFO/IDH/MocA-like oxidoreductase domain-containing protein n=1 Tax=Polymorphospora rubra TaxID=338584 RepID=A0A810MWC4_9ACTN|nr:hypothetical protein [Polymorphospora rubra]BCJ64279.1 hypothetical protein Prubr_13000 [Polymorphospora rubra]